MAVPRSSSTRGSKPSARRTPAQPDPRDFQAEDVADPTVPRSVISFALRRRATLESLRRGAGFARDVCDADPNLMRAARFHGEPTERICPICSRAGLVEVNWVHGGQLGSLSGSARSREQLLSMAGEYGQFRVFVVEVCRGCAWNHLLTCYTLGDGVPRHGSR